ncbi:MAG: protein kinase [Streptococcaceae bacterium]|jgi:serine/threonine protein kinase|nr:protein kinase [Streptococcaceae bacterium]
MIFWSPDEIIHERYRIKEMLGISGQAVTYCAENVGGKSDQVRSKANKLVFIKAYKDVKPDRVEEFEAFFSYIITQIPDNQRDFFCLPIYSKNDQAVNKVAIGVSTSEQVYAVFPWLTGQTLQKLMENGPIADNEKKRIVLSMLKSCRTLADNNIVHLDLKPDNFFVQYNNNKLYLRLIDLDLARISQSPDGEFTGIRPLGGTPCYRSPEQYLGDPKKISSKSDVFCLGILLSQILMNHYPFTENDEGSICKEKFFFPQTQLHPDLIKMISNCLAAEPKKRPTIYSLLHAFTIRAGTNFKSLECRVQISDGEAEYNYHATTKFSKQDLRGFIKNLPSSPSFRIDINKVTGNYTLTRLTDELNILYNGKTLEINKPHYLGLADPEDDPAGNFKIGEKKLSIYLIDV